MMNHEAQVTLSSESGNKLLINLQTNTSQSLNDPLLDLTATIISADDGAAI
jgi:hypothetical protein